MSKIYAIVKIDSLKQHEMIGESHLKELIGEIKKDGYINDPLIVDKNSNIILDGHHRFNALKFLGLALAPVYLCRL
jgi:L-serine kinase (ADP)